MRGILNLEIPPNSVKAFIQFVWEKNQLTKYSDNWYLQWKRLYYSNWANLKGYWTSSGLMGRVFANGSGDLGSIPGRVMPKTFKMVLDTSLLNTQQYKVRI